MSNPIGVTVTAGSPKGARTIITVWHPDSPRDTTVSVVTYQHPRIGKRVYAAGIFTDNKVELYSEDFSLTVVEAYRWACIMAHVLRHSTGLSHREISFRCNIASLPNSSLSRNGQEKVRWAEAVIGESWCNRFRNMPLSRMPREVQAAAQKSARKRR